MSEFDIKFVTKKVVKGRAVAEFLAQQPIDDDQEWSLEFPDEHLRSITVQGWRMYFDGASNKAGAGIGVIIVTPVTAFHIFLTRNGWGEERFLFFRVSFKLEIS
ncbi:UNVERIFIED_CONTAM: hypothetical protein Sradi_1327400 [Sesamum radiatum]|uniref:Uncharacterized protein n=1 Tax=Sesamum radiatum TaxID=300843 RepID=A0AAW2J7U2_SESRA